MVSESSQVRRGSSSSIRGSHGNLLVAPQKVATDSNKLALEEVHDIGIETEYVVTLKLLANLNVSQSANDNKLHLDDHGGPECLAKNMNVDPRSGLQREQVLLQRRAFGSNFFPDSPMESFWSLLIEALSDSTLMILTVAAVVSLVIGVYEDPVVGWVEGAAILIAVMAVSSISAGNDYNKQLQFRDLEKASAKDEMVSILRDGIIDRYPITDIVVGDIIVLMVRHPGRASPTCLAVSPLLSTIPPADSTYRILTPKPSP